MPLDLRNLVDPTHTAVVTCELQRGVIGDLASTPELAEEVASRRVLEAAATLARAARAHHVRIVHATVEMRADRAGLSINNPLMAYVTKNETQVLQGSPYAELVPELGPEPSDIVVRRIHGLTPFTGTELDAILRNLGVRTIVPVGVSVNEALLGTCISAADLGYRIVLPTDAIAGVPEEYADAVVGNTLALLANLATVDQVIDVWSTAVTG
jgi:nicotinamidase-related amidase